MSKHELHPPRWAERFLEWYCKPELLEDLQGDLNEYFERNVSSKGKLRARLIYLIDVVKFIRPYTVRRPNFVSLFIQRIMLASYFKTSTRSILRNKLFSTINIAGLAISMSVGLLMIGLLFDIYSYDRFHTKRDQIYRLNSRYEFRGNKDNSFMATSSLKAGRAIKENVAGVEDVAILHRGFKGDMALGEKAIPLRGFWANESFFNVFSFSLIEGNASKALVEPFSVVLTEESARKLFGSEPALGKTLVMNKDRNYTVTGVMKDVPHFSHMQFQMLGSMSTRDILEKDEPRLLAWDNMWSTWTYLLLEEGTAPRDLDASLKALCEEQDKTVKNTHIEIKLQPLASIMTGEKLGNQIGTTMGSTLIWVFSGLTFVVILSACFNYTNLSIARSLQRSREVGIRKVIGALKSHVLGQFVTESVIISVLALVASFGIFLLVRPYFLGLHSDLQETLQLNLNAPLVLAFLGLAIVVGIAAGFLPALFFARVNAIQVLKKVGQGRVLGKLTARKVLITFQYCISLMLITGTIIIYKQYHYFLAFDLGYSTDNVLNISLQGNKPDHLKKLLHELPEVKGVSQSVMITSVGNYWGSNVRNSANREDSLFVFSNMVDENYLPLHGHQLLAGRTFTPLAEDAVESELIVNEEVLRRLQIGKGVPADALGETVLVDGKELTIVGVIRDFKYGQASDGGAKEIMFRYSNKEAEWLNVKIESEDALATVAKIKAVWQKVDKVHPFEATFYQDAIEDSFRGMSASAKAAGFIAFLAICIASMGLLGMVVFTSETRIKEIGIRKVMGASEKGLVYLLGKGFVWLLVVAAAIALPVTYLFFEKVLFPEMPNHMDLQWIDGAISFVAVFAFAGLMIGLQTLKVAKTNPAQVLRSE